MAPIMTRVDDRLLHGQVVLGWGPTVRPELIVVADDRAAGDDWEREAYEASGPADAEVRVVPLAECARIQATGEFERVRTLVLVRGPRELVSLVRLGFEVTDLNVGRLHAEPGREPWSEELDELRVTDEERWAFHELGTRGVACYFQPLPSDPRRLLVSTDGIER